MAFVYVQKFINQIINQGVKKSISFIEIDRKKKFGAN